MKNLEKMDEIYQQIGQFLAEHPEAVHMSNDESYALYEQWVKK